MSSRISTGILAIEFVLDIWWLVVSVQDAEAGGRGGNR